MPWIPSGVVIENAYGMQMELCGNCSAWKIKNGDHVDCSNDTKYLEQVIHNIISGKWTESIYKIISCPGLEGREPKNARSTTGFIITPLFP